MLICLGYFLLEVAILMVDDFVCEKTMTRGLEDNREVLINLGSNTMWLVPILSDTLEGDEHMR